MSFDLAVWSRQSDTATRRPNRIYDSICRGERPAELVADSAVGSFYIELTSRWPELSSAREHSPKNTVTCPWAAELHRSESYVQISCVWSRAEEVYAAVQQLARKHNLVFYDPQADEVTLPE